MKKKLAAVGDNCMDVYDGLGAAFPGGNPVNVAVYTVRLGGYASYTGVVGDDAYGIKMRESIAFMGVDISHLRTEPGHTAVTHVAMVGEDRVLGEYEEGVMASFRLTDDDIAFLLGHDLVVSGLWGHIIDDLPLFKNHGVPVAFDFADREDGSEAKKALPYVDYAFFSHGGNDQEVRLFLKGMQGKGPRIAVATRGQNGSMAYDGVRFYVCPADNCEVVDTMGAGDSYIAGFLFGLLNGDTVFSCMERGTKCSSETLGYRGSW